MKMDSPCTTVSKESVLDCTDSDYRVCEESGLDDLHRPQLVQYLKNLGLKTQNACVPLLHFAVLSNLRCLLMSTIVFVFYVYK